MALLCGSSPGFPLHESARNDRGVQLNQSFPVRGRASEMPSPSGSLVPLGGTRLLCAGVPVNFGTSSEKVTSSASFAGPNGDLLAYCFSLLMADFGRVKRTGWR